MTSGKRFGDEYEAEEEIEFEHLPFALPDQNQQKLLPVGCRTMKRLISTRATQCRGEYSIGTVQPWD
jgi:hypothetical protein